MRLKNALLVTNKYEGRDEENKISARDFISIAIHNS
jgi:hypothetical protein